MRIFIILLSSLILLISGCQDTTTSINQKKESPVTDKKDAIWIPSSTFRSNDQSKMIGISQKLGIICSENPFI